MGASSRADALREAAGELTSALAHIHDLRHHHAESHPTALVSRLLQLEELRDEVFVARRAVEAVLAVWEPQGAQGDGGSAPW